MSIQWNPSYAVGVDLIDVQHRELFRRVSSLVESMRSAQGKESVTEVLQFLGEYVVDHFGTEAKLMAQHHYPGAAAHLAEHAQFVATFKQLRVQLEQQGPSAHLAMEVNNKVCNWLVKHVLGTDKSLGAFLSNANKG